MGELMIYGAAGYNGRMASTNAKAHGLELVIAGRVQDETRLSSLAEGLGVKYPLFAADDWAAAAASLDDPGVLLAPKITAAQAAIASPV